MVAALLVGAGVFLLTQGDERSEEEQAYIDAMAEVALANQDEEEIELNEDQAQCMATAAVDVVGVDRLRETATPQEIRENPDEEPLESIQLDREQATDFYGRTGECIDWREVFLADLERTGYTSEQLDCIDRSISDDILRDLIVAGFTEDEDQLREADREAEEATEDCDLGS